MQTKCHANLPLTLSAHFILEYIVNCSRVFKAFLGHFTREKKKKQKETKEKKILQFYLSLSCCLG